MIGLDLLVESVYSELAKSQKPLDVPLKLLKDKANLTHFLA